MNFIFAICQILILSFVLVQGEIIRTDGNCQKVDHTEKCIATGETNEGEVLWCPYDGKEKSLKSSEVLTIPDVWVRVHGSSVPPHAVFAGRDRDGDQIFVGRARLDSELLPAKVIPNKNNAFMGNDGHEYSRSSYYEVLVGDGYNWIPASYGSVPPNAVRVGRSIKGETLYIGRGSHAGSLTPGKIHPSFKCMFIPYGGVEICLKHYECLVKNFY